MSGVAEEFSIYLQMLGLGWEIAAIIAGASTGLWAIGFAIWLAGFMLWNGVKL
jgi:hypothetical protein